MKVSYEADNYGDSIGVYLDSGEEIQRVCVVEDGPKEAKQLLKVLKELVKEETKQLRAENAKLREKLAGVESQLAGRRQENATLGGNLAQSIEEYWELEDKLARTEALLAEARATAPCGAVEKQMKKVVLDPCCGGRMFWFDKQDCRAVFGDIRREEHILCDGRTHSVNPDVILDYRDLPYDTGTFPLVVFDPPHSTRAGATGWLGKKYGCLTKQWREDLRAGFKECFRVASDWGTVIFKWNETDVPLSEVLKLTDERPLFGHRSGKRSKTHWVAFIKSPRRGE